MAMAMAAMIAPTKPWTSSPLRNLSLINSTIAAMIRDTRAPTQPPPIEIPRTPSNQVMSQATTAMTMAAMMALAKPLTRRPRLSRPTIQMTSALSTTAITMPRISQSMSRSPFC